MTAALGERLAVFRDVALCDRHDHECSIVSDGQRAYVWPLEPLDVAEDTIVARVGVTLTAACPVPLSEDVQCDGQLVWKLDTPDTWTADADARRLLTAYGRGVES